MFDIRAGINSGPLVAGIVGVKKFAYDIWGDTVNMAARMQQEGEVGKINISGDTYELIKNNFACVHRGKHDVKNAVIALPPVEEQKAICKWIADQCKPLEEAILRAEEEIKLIREYRDRQIADVVTGQVDVRGWVPGPDDVVAEEDLAALGGDEEINTDGEENDGDD